MSKLEEFKEIWNMVERKGKENILDFLENKSDYFVCPASTKFHSSCEGGLSAHSIMVYNKLLELTKNNNLVWKDKDSVAIICLLHDLCKVNFYKVEYKNAKNESGQWIKVPYYSVEDKMPIGVHGDKSVILIQQLGLKLTSEEVYCIRYHMGAYEGQSVITTLGNAIKKCPNILWVELADQLATLEEESEEKIK